MGRDQEILRQRAEIVRLGRSSARSLAPRFLTPSDSSPPLHANTACPAENPVTSHMDKHFNLAFILATLKMGIRTEGKNEVKCQCWPWEMTKFIEGECGINKDL